MKGTFRGARAVVMLGGATLLVALAAWLAGPSGGGPDTRAPSRSARSVPTATGGDCADCHPGPARAWTGSNHDRALELPGEHTVLGAFDGRTLEHFGHTTRFFRRGAEYWVQTQDAQGASSEFRVVYSVGARPLQQYLVEAPRGRLQVLPFGWDTRPVDQGGNRWFPIYPEDDIAPGDPLHWTGPSFTWNSMCAECHSTDLQKRYDAAADSFHTTWKHINVACEACHGAGDAHTTWANAHAGGGPTPADAHKGLLSSLHQEARRWERPAGQRIASPKGPSASTAILSMCARCHARRTPIRAETVGPGPLLESYVPTLIREPFYFADGQIRDEVYEWGSFLQSKMHAVGVTCVDCHESHSLKVQDPEPSSVCQKCHQPEHYESVQHHFHDPQGPGGSCVSCHMPERLYMVVDARRDHSLRVPRPDLTVKLQTPNACNGCHKDRSPQWAQAAVERWYPNGRWREPHFGEAFAKATAGDPSAVESVLAIVSDPSVPPIIRASAIERLQAFLNVDDRVMEAVAAAAQHEDPLIRLGASVALSGLGPSSLPVGTAVLERLCKDPIAAVAVEAGRSAAAVRALLPSEGRTRFDQAIERTLAAEGALSEFPLSQYNTALLLLALERTSQAEAAFRRALKGSPSLLPAILDLADLLRATGRDAEAEPLLRRATTLDGDRAAAHVALGLWLVRNGKADEALRQLALATESNPPSSHAAYVYGVALESNGDVEGALRVFEKGLKAHPFDQGLHGALVETYRTHGRDDEAQRALQRWRDLFPRDPALRQGAP